ncbi:hypothetical protein JNUCC23_10280 [Peribacillus sp. JNUCC 23]
MMPYSSMSSPMYSGQQMMPYPSMPSPMYPGQQLMPREMQMVPHPILLVARQTAPN